MASCRMFAAAQHACGRSLRPPSQAWSPAVQHKRSLTQGETRQAARNAKAELLRACAVASTAEVKQEPAATGPSSFLKLNVDDRVVVSTPFGTDSTRCNQACQKHECGPYAEDCESSSQGRLQENDVQAPTFVQQAAIPAVLSGKNVAMQCYTGSGKVKP